MRIIMRSRSIRRRSDISRGRIGGVRGRYMRFISEFWRYVSEPISMYSDLVIVTRIKYSDDYTSNRDDLEQLGPRGSEF